MNTNPILKIELFDTHVSFSYGRSFSGESAHKGTRKDAEMAIGYLINKYNPSKTTIKNESKFRVGETFGLQVKQ